MSNSNQNNPNSKILPNTLQKSTYSVTPDELEHLYQQHWEMKQQIQLLKNTLSNCENKWNMVVNSLVKENVDLKASEEYYKAKYHHLQQKIHASSKRHKKNSPLLTVAKQQQPKNNKQLKTSFTNNHQLQLKTSSHPSTLSSYNLSSLSNTNSHQSSLSNNNNLNDTEISEVKNLWKNYYLLDENQSQHSFCNSPSRKYQ